MSSSADSLKTSPYDYLFKLLIVGDSSVGKSSLLLRFTDSVFNESYAPTIGVDYRVRTVVVDDKTVKLQIWDTAGQERFRTIASSYYRGAHGILIVYDITNEKTFENIPFWMKNVERYGCENVAKLLIGNKCDLGSSRRVSTEMAQSCSEQYDMQVIETSAKSSKNVEEAFLKLARIIKSNVSLSYNIAEEDSIRIGDTSPVTDTGGSWCPCAFNRMRTALQAVLFFVLVNIVLTCVDVLFILDPSSELSRSRAIKVANELPKDSGIRPSLAVRRQNGAYVFIMTENLNNLTTTLESVDGNYERYLNMVTSEIMRRRHVRPLIILLFSDKEMNTTLVTFWKDLSKTRKIHVFRVGTTKLRKFNELFAKDGKSFHDLIACDARQQGVLNVERRSPLNQQQLSTSTYRVTLPFSKTTPRATTTRPVSIPGPKVRPIFRRKDKQKEELRTVVTPPPTSRIVETHTGFRTLTARPTTTRITIASRITTTTKPTTTTQRVPIGCVADVIFLMDFSDSNGNNSKHYLDVAAATVGKLPIASNAVRVALIRYSGPGRTETLFHLDKHKRKDNLIEELLHNEETTGGTTRTGEAIRHAIKEFSNPKHGARKNAQKVIVVFTDGYSQDDPATAVDEARRASITMLVVAIRDTLVPPNEEELAVITKIKTWSSYLRMGSSCATKF
ncbi:hypothetical protein KIN20_003465 [Parelaphostrongylus tenuis]|uniref:VWFA domain-containing protein n=1 Tax=Parelaphostrongylus tenuis TaxID=148309 RepID=A0AAD5MIB0_PARTN|nr:hypothetical protein KIN20_003465 [Parelaphostrongylus tenuis]